MSDSNSNRESEKKVRLGDNVDSITVVDPDNYHKTKKLQAIEEAKQNYKRYLTDHSKIYRELSDTWSNPKETLKSEREEALALYGTELMPLIEEGLSKGAISEEDLKVDTNPFVDSLLNVNEIDVRYFVDNHGAILANGEVHHTPKTFLQRIYRKFQSIERKLGLGLELEENKGPAEI